MSAEQFQQLIQAITQTRFKEGSLEDCPYKFDGSCNHHEIEDFITNVSIYIITEHITESNAILSFDILLRGEARRWWNKTKLEMSTWMDVISAIRKDFQQHRTIDSSSNETGQVRQHNYQSTDAYNCQQQSKEIKSQHQDGSLSKSTAHINVLRYQQLQSIDPGIDGKLSISTQINCICAQRRIYEGKNSFKPRKKIQVLILSKRRFDDESSKWLSNTSLRSPESTRKDDERRNKYQMRYFLKLCSIGNLSSNLGGVCSALSFYQYSTINEFKTFAPIASGKSIAHTKAFIQMARAPAIKTFENNLTTHQHVEIAAI